MHEIQFFGLYFPPLLIAIILGYVSSAILLKLIHALNYDMPYSGSLPLLSLTVILSSLIFYFMY